MENNKEKEQEKRKYPRVDRHFIVSYRKAEEDKVIDVSQTKNLSLGGALVTTLKEFKPDTQLVLALKMPGREDLIEINAKVIACTKSGCGSLYDTRMEFLCVDEECAELIKPVIEHYLRKDE